MDREHKIVSIITTILGYRVIIDHQSLTLFNGAKINLKVVNGKISFDLVPSNKKSVKLHSTI